MGTIFFVFNLNIFFIMNQNLSAYDTFVGRFFDPASINKSIQAIEDALVLNDSLLENAQFIENGIFAISNDGMNYPECENINLALITHSTPAEVAIKPFTFPLIIKHPSSYRKMLLIVGDARPFMKVDQKNGGSKVVNNMEMALLAVMMRLTSFWVSGNKMRLLDLGFVQQQVFCRWVSDGVGNWFELDLEQKQKLKVLTAFYYQGLFHERENFGDIARNVMLQTAFKAAGVNNYDIRIHFENIDHIPTFEAFISEAKRILDTPRLDNLNLGVWSKLIGGTWFGFNGREIANAALEHPPTFLAMLYLSFAQSSYRKAGLSRISENFKGPKGGLEFVRGYQLM